MDRPCFIDIEMSSPDPEGFPIAIAWSLPDGQIKSALIAPDDVWLEEGTGLPSHFELDETQLMEQGYSPMEIIRELTHDIATPSLFNDGLDDDEAALDMMFSSFGEDLNFEVNSAVQVLKDVDLEHWIQWRNQQIQERGLQPDHAETNVILMLLAADYFGYL